MKPTDRIWLDGTVDSESDDYRDAYERDSDILLYSSAFRRLKGVTQVTPVVDGNARTHDRMIHSLKVAQVGKRIAQHLIGDEKNSENKEEYAHYVLPEAVHFAGLAHDLGHPPFGHVAENELQLITSADNNRRLPDSFEGNAQTFHILVRLSQKRMHAGDDAIEGARPGMGITAGSLIASMKYPWRKDCARIELSELNRFDETKERYYREKWGCYDEDWRPWKSIRQEILKAEPQYVVNSEIMDLADDITYAVHDLIDYYRIGAIPPLNAILQKGDFKLYAAAVLSTKGLSDDESMQAAFRWISQLPTLEDQYDDSRRWRAKTHAFESAAVGKMISKTKITKDFKLEVPDYIRAAIAILKQLTWYYVIDNPSLSSSQRGQRQIIRELHAWLCEWYESCEVPPGDPLAHAKHRRNLRRIPVRFKEYCDAADDRRVRELDDKDKLMVDDRTSDIIYREMTKDERISRAAIDYISGLTDGDAIRLHHSLGAIAGVSPETWL